MATLVATTALTAGCGSSVEGSNVEGNAIAGERWDPCSITDDAIAATGLDPASRVVGWGEGIEVVDWTHVAVAVSTGVVLFTVDFAGGVEPAICHIATNPYATARRRAMQCGRK